MPKKAAAGLPIPARLTFETINGQDFVRVQAAAKLAGIHPDVLAAAQRLLKAPSGEAFIFKLGSPELLAKATDIEAYFVRGFRKVGRAFGGGKASSYFDREQKRLVFWFAK